ncbi:MAG TPA: hypothetical protein VEV17_16690 [Bryobacteraceae bacterium]|nr:hypothetical protein [Bryobacteraceae bacterium]
MIAIALSFDSGILLCADTKYGVPARAHPELSNTFSKQYRSEPGYARSIFLVSEPSGCRVAAVQYSESALDILSPAEYTIDQMRATIENSLSEIYRRQPEAAMLVTLYSALDRQYSLFHTSGAALKELAGYDCQGAAAYLGHYLIRERYEAMRSMDALDLRSIFSLATETLDRVRESCDGCGEFTEIFVLYANGRASGVQRIRQGARELPELALRANLVGT